MAGRPWTDQEHQQLTTLFRQGHSPATIAVEIGRTPLAVRMMITETPWLRRKPRQSGGPLFMLADVAALLAIPESVVHFWCRRQAFPQAYARHQYKHGIWRIEDRELRIWLYDKRSWTAWQPDRITDDAWRTEMLRLRRDWLSTAEARKLLSFSRSGFQGLVETKRLKGELVGRTRWFKRQAIQHFARANGIWIEAA